MSRRYIFLLILGLVLPFTACRKEEYNAESEQEKVQTTPLSEKDPIVGFYVLNNGGKGNNETTIDYFDFTNGTYYRNIFTERNPDVASTLGDNGVEMKVYNDRLYIVVNNSHRVVVLDAHTTKYIGEIRVNDCHGITFAGDTAGYISSYLRPNTPEGNVPLGEVVRFDLRTLQITGRVAVGCQPEQLLVRGDKLLVCNTGAYREGTLDNRVSIIQLEDFTQAATVEIGSSPFAIVSGEDMVIASSFWVATHGNGRDEGSRIYRLDMDQDGDVQLGKTRSIIKVKCFCMENVHDVLYFISGDRNRHGHVQNARFLQLNMLSGELIRGDLITDHTREEIQNPTNLTVHPTTNQIFITDAKNFTSSGVLFCYSKDGKKLWSVRTGIIPKKVAFVYKKGTK